jgi:hypothetical protein
MKARSCIALTSLALNQTSSLSSWHRDCILIRGYVNCIPPCFKKDVAAALEREELK